MLQELPILLNLPLESLDLPVNLRPLVRLKRVLGCFLNQELEVVEVRQFLRVFGRLEPDDLFLLVKDVRVLAEVLVLGAVAHSEDLNFLEAVVAHFLQFKQLQTLEFGIALASDYHDFADFAFLSYAQKLMFLRDMLELGLDLLKNTLGVWSLEHKVHVCVLAAVHTSQGACVAWLFRESVILLTNTKANLTHSLFGRSVRNKSAIVVVFFDPKDVILHKVAFFSELLISETKIKAVVLSLSVPRLHDHLSPFLVVLVIVKGITCTSKQVIVLPLLELEVLIEPSVQSQTLTVFPVQLFVALKLNNLILVFFPVVILPVSSLLIVQILPGFELDFARIFHPIFERVVTPIFVIFVLPKAKLLHLLLIGFPVLKAVDPPAIEVLFVFSFLPIDELSKGILVLLPDL